MRNRQRDNPQKEYVKQLCWYFPTALLKLDSLVWHRRIVKWRRYLWVLFFKSKKDAQKQGHLGIVSISQGIWVEGHETDDPLLKLKGFLKFSSGLKRRTIFCSSEIAKLAAFLRGSSSVKTCSIKYMPANVIQVL